MLTGCLRTLAFLLAASLPTFAQVRVSEILYHPASESPAEEFVELLNTSPTNVVLSGWRITGGIDFAFGIETIPAGGCLVVAADLARFQSKYPGVTNVTGNWLGTLSNSRNTVRVENAAGKTVDSVTYADQGDWAIRQRSVSLPVG